MPTNTQPHPQRPTAPLAEALPRVVLPYQDPTTERRGFQFGLRRRRGGLESRIWLESGKRLTRCWQEPTTRIPPGRLPRPLWAFERVGEYPQGTWLALAAPDCTRPLSPGDVLKPDTPSFPWKIHSERYAGSHRLIELPFDSVPPFGVSSFDDDGTLKKIRVDRPRGLSAEHFAQLVLVSS
jgi:hypothetical protein